MEFCSLHYGYVYSSDDGYIWPVARFEDFSALTRVIKALYVEMEKQKYRDQLNSSLKATNRFELLDFKD